MARNQVWDMKGNLIEDIEVPDVMFPDPVTELEAKVAALSQLLVTKSVITQTEKDAVILNPIKDMKPIEDVKVI